MNILRHPDHIKVFTESGTHELEHTGDTWQSKNIQMELNISRMVSITLAPSPEAIKRIRIRWKGDNHSVKLILNDQWERACGDIFWQCVQPEKILPWYFNAFDGKITNGYGVKTGCNAMCFWLIDAQGITLWLDVRCGSKGVHLKEPIEAATVVTRQGQEKETPFQACSEFCKLMCDHPKNPNRPVYGANNWYYAYGDISRESVLKDAELVADLTADTDYVPYMLIDDGWQACRYPGFIGGPWQGNSYFGDMGRVADDIKRKGCIPSIWIRPLLTAERIPESFYLNKAYTHTQGIIMDPSNPDVLNKIYNDIRTLSDMGYKLIKHDFTTQDMMTLVDKSIGAHITNEGWSFQDNSKTSAQIIKRLYQTIKDGARDSMIMGCNTYNHLSAGINELQRSGGDTSGRVWEISRMHGINTLAFRLPQNNNFFMVDADCAGITEKIPFELNRRFMELIAISGTALFASIKPGLLNDQQQNQLAQIFKKASYTNNCMEPLDWMNTTCPSKYSHNDKEYNFDWYDLKDGVQTFYTWFD